MQERSARSLSLSLALSLWSWLEVAATRSSSWHRNGVRSGNGSSCGKIKLLMRKESLGSFGGKRGFLNRPAQLGS